MTIAILDPFSGISGDMTLGALIDVGLDVGWLEALPQRLGLDGVTVRVQDVLRGDIACKKVDFDIPPQPHGRHIRQIRQMIADAGLPASVQERANACFTAIAVAEGAIHGMDPDAVHLHEVGAVDAILDVVGVVWGLEQLGVEQVYCGAPSLGDGFVRAAHGVLPVPAPATLKLLEGYPVRPGPEGSGELVTPTGAALIRILSSGVPPAEYVPRRSGFGAGSRDPHGRANALRIVLADAATASAPATAPAGAGRETLVMLAADIDDAPGEYIAAAADLLRERGALDVVLVATTMKKGRPGTRVEVLCAAADADTLETTLLMESGTIGVRRWPVERRALPREMHDVDVLGQRVAVKVVTLPDGRRRGKPEFDDVRRAAGALGRPVSEVLALAATAAADA